MPTTPRQFTLCASVTLLVMLSSASTVAFAQAQARDEAACVALSKLTLPGVALSEVKTQWYPAGSTPPPEPYAPPLTASLPAFCRFDATLDRRTGVDGKPYGIGIAITLPADWNGRYLQQGGGGLNGTVAFPLGRTAMGDGDAALAHGFAVATTDTGHKGQVFDASFMRDQQASLDFAYQAVGRVAQLVRQILTTYYGVPPKTSVFAGCSTGGREGMLMAERYPTYFDGIVVGAPAMRTNFSGIGDEWVSTALNAVAPKDAAGKPDTKRALSDADRKTVIDGLLNACDAGDGLKDGMVLDPLGCRFDPATLVCQGAKADGCLTKEQAAAITKGLAGPKDSKGRQVYPGFLYDTGIAATQGLPGLLVGTMNPVGTPYAATEMDVDARAAAAASDPRMWLTSTAGWTNLSTFSGHGGKLIFYHGVSDPWFSALDTLEYYQRMTQASGGAAQVMNWSRFFLVPGMSHCGGGQALDSFDMIGAVVDWVEKGTAPASVTATGRAFPGRSRPLCAYPQHAQYKGSGNPDDAANFECRD